MYKHITVCLYYACPEYDKRFAWSDELARKVASLE